MQAQGLGSATRMRAADIREQAVRSFRRRPQAWPRSFLLFEQVRRRRNDDPKSSSPREPFRRRKVQLSLLLACRTLTLIAATTPTSESLTAESLSSRCSTTTSAEESGASSGTPVGANDCSSRRCMAGSASWISRDWEGARAWSRPRMPSLMGTSRSRMESIGAGGRRRRGRTWWRVARFTITPCMSGRVNAQRVRSR